MTAPNIHIKGARVHNLQNLEVRIPRHALTVITGLSGSGKSSLAFDTLYAEGYRKFLDSLSPRVRSLLEQTPKPDVDFIHGLSPVIAVEQRENAGSNPRSTMATVTDVANYARLVWALGGEARCPDDGGRIEQRSLDDCLDQVMELPEGSRILVIAPYMNAKAAVIRGEIPHLKVKGFNRLRIDGNVVEIENEDIIPPNRTYIQLDIVVDRLIVSKGQRSRLADSLEMAFKEGKNQALISWQAEKDQPWQDLPLSQHLACRECGKSFEPVTPRLFSHDHPRGACPACGGLGKTLQFREELLVPDPSKPVRKGALKPLRLGSKRMIMKNNAVLKQLSEQMPFDPLLPWKDLADDVRHKILHGDDSRAYDFKLKPGRGKAESMKFEGVLAMLDATRRETSSDSLRQRLLAFQISQHCTTCQGQRLSREASSVFVDGLSYPDFMQLTLAEAHNHISKLKLPQLSDALNGLEQRLRFLNEVGLGYLTLNRPYSTLSGGEAQRARLASHLGTGLVGVTYILDEPTIGLHPRDTERLIHSIKKMRDQGNTVVVVEHDPDMIRAADHLIELGPKAGKAGGRLLFNGSISEARKVRNNVTMDFLDGRLKVDRHSEQKSPTGDWIKINKAAENNLKDLNVSIPVGLITSVTGVSGSGKSTLITEILAKTAAMKLNRARQIPGKHGGIAGLEIFDRVVVVDQEPIGRSPRSNPATYVKLLDALRALFAQCSLSKVRGYKPSRFSFNVRGGRCERCQGDGMIKLDMQFLHDVYSECPSCHGKRYNRETLEVRYRGVNIADVLEMTVDEALSFFTHQPKVFAGLETLSAVGLGYLHLGQAANTLSGGEAQRIKLSLELTKGRRGQTLYILDEPTTGLHWIDIQHLMDLLFRLRDQGHTLVLIEHNMDVIKLSDWIIDLGPGGGNDGGHLVYSGPFNEMKGTKGSYTAQYIS
jgi:excinuclease ABC subunit A